MVKLKPSEKPNFSSNIVFFLLYSKQPLCHPHSSAESQTTPKCADVKTELWTTILIEAPVVLTQWTCSHIISWPSASQARRLRAPLWVLSSTLSLNSTVPHIPSKASNTCLPEHFMLCSVAANWWVRILGLIHSRNTHAHTQTRTHTPS